MPNWVYNVLGAHDEQGRQFIFDNCINDKKNFTFNKMIPMPQILTIGCSPVRICNNFDEFKEKYITIRKETNPVRKRMIQAYPGLKTEFRHHLERKSGKRHEKRISK